MSPKISHRGYRQRGISRTRALAPTVRSTKFWAQDDAEFDRELQRKGCTPADLLRDIVHQWARKKRLSGHVSDDIENTVRKAHEKLVADQVAPIKEGLGLVLEQLKTQSSFPLTPNGVTPLSREGNVAALTDARNRPHFPLLDRVLDELARTRNDINLVSQTIAQAASMQGEQLSLNEAQLRRLMALADSHYMLSGQSFAATWAVLDFIQRYLVEPVVKKHPSYKDDAYQASANQRDDARTEGLQMVHQMSETFLYPGTFEALLIPPPEETEAEDLP